METAVGGKFTFLLRLWQKNHPKLPQTPISFTALLENPSKLVFCSQCYFISWIVEQKHGFTYQAEPPNISH